MTHNKRYISKSLLSVILSVCMLISCMTVGFVPTDAAKIDSENLVGGAGSTSGDWHISNSMQGKWDSTSAYKMTRTSATDYNRDFYFTKSDTNGLSFRFWSKTDNNKLGAYYGNDHAVPSSGGSGTSKDHDGQGVWGWGNTWKFTPEEQLSGDGFYKVTIHLSPGGGYTGDWYEYNETRYFSGRTWYSTSALGTLSPVITTKLNGTAASTFTTDDTVSLSTASSNNVGTVTYSYEYKVGSGSYQSISGNSFKPSATGTYTIKVTATDTGVVTSGTSKNAFTARTETAETTITVNEPKFNISIAAKTNNTVSTTGGTVSPSAYTNLELNHDAKEITATPNSASNYVFSGWTSANGNVIFADQYAATTTFTATAADTIYANFTQDTVFEVTVNNNYPSVQSAVSAGSVVSPELTAATPENDEYSFTEWTLTGGVTLAAGYHTTDKTIKILATGEGTITANYEHRDYIYFYAALQSNWNSNPVVTVDGEALTAYAWIVNTSGTARTLYNESGNAIGANNCNTYYIGVFRALSSKVGTNVHVFNSALGATETNGNCGTLSNEHGYCYYTYSAGTDKNTSGLLNPQKVITVTTNKAEYDADETVTINRTERKYSGVKTAGRDDFTYSYKLVNTSDGTEYTVQTDASSSTNNFSFVPKNISGFVPGTYKLVFSTKDAATGRMVNSCESSAFEIQAKPTQSKVTFSQTTSGAHSSFTGSYTYKTQAAASFSSGSSLRAGSQVTLTLKLNTGYTQGTLTTAGIAKADVTETYSSSTNTVTLGFTVPTGGSDITISYAAKEILQTITVVDSFGNTIESKQAGVATEAELSKPQTVTDYSFSSWAIPSSLTQTSGSDTTNGVIKVKIKPANIGTATHTVTINYTETLYDVTLQNDGHGTVQRNSANVTTTQIGNVTKVNLTAANSPGYELKEWVVTAGSATKVKFGDTEKTFTNGAVTIAAPTDSEGAVISTGAFRVNGTATIKANFKAVDYSISVKFPDGNTYDKNETNGNHVSVSKSSGTIGTSFEIRVLLAPGYEVDTITGDGVGTMPSPATDGNIRTYTYTLGAESVNAVVALKAAQPTITQVQLKGIENDFAYKTVANGGTVTHYYLQPDDIKVTTNAYAKVVINNTTTPVTEIAKQTSASNVTHEKQLSANASALPQTAEGTASYQITVTVTNLPNGIAANQAKTATYSCTVNVTLNEAQKKYFNFKRLFDRCVDESSHLSDTTYYQSGAPLQEYVNAYNTANSYLSGYPAYNAGSDKAAEVQSQYTDFLSAYNALMSKAKKTTVYVLSKHANSSSAPINFYADTNGTADDWAHFRMGDISSNVLETNANHYHMTYYGTVTKNSTPLYLYTFTYTGHVKFTVWKGASATDVSYSGKTLTGTVANVTDFGDYYVNVYNIDTGTSFKNASEYSDFGVSHNNDRHLIEVGDTLTASQIKTKFGIANSGSVVSNPGINATNATFEITGPIGKNGSSTVNLLEKDFEAKKQGKYRVRYVTTYGTNASNAPIYGEAIMYLWVAFDEVSIYVDMNSNIGNPVLNFKYLANQYGEYDPNGTEAYLSYEMDLVTGSESIYEYTITLSNLEQHYGIQFDLSRNTPITIDYITVENEKIGKTTGGFQIGIDARITGEAWLKADSTNMKTFENISYGSVTSTFMAAVEGENNQATLLPSAFNSVRGTGIISDEEDAKYEAKYAALYVPEGEQNPMRVFNYAHTTAAKKEIKTADAVYYFDRWISYQTPTEDVDVESGEITLPASNKRDSVTGDYDVSLLGARSYGDGGSDLTYVALYKKVMAADPVVRVEITYEFKDYVTSDGNYIYNPQKETEDASYTKTVKIETGTEAYANYSAVVAAADSIARTNMPHIDSSYFDYSYTDNSAVVDTEKSREADRKVYITAQVSHEAHEYTIHVFNSSYVEVATQTGTYQNSVELTSSISHPVWKDAQGQILGVGASYTARFTDRSAGGQVIYVVDDSSIENNEYTSVITYDFTEYYTQNSTEMARHNFNIIDYCGEGELIGGGVLFATTDGTNYRQTTAAQKLADSDTRETFISGILDGDYTTEYPVQTIQNVGFRYKPYRKGESVYRYSDDMKAYLTTFDIANTNSENYDGQTLRIFSFAVYQEGNETVIVPSEGFAEVRRYTSTTQS